MFVLFSLTLLYNVLFISTSCHLELCHKKIYCCSSQICYSCFCWFSSMFFGFLSLTKSKCQNSNSSHVRQRVCKSQFSYVLPLVLSNIESLITDLCRAQLNHPILIFAGRNAAIFQRANNRCVGLLGTPVSHIAFYHMWSFIFLKIILDIYWPI